MTTANNCVLIASRVSDARNPGGCISPHRGFTPLGSTYFPLTMGWSRLPGPPRVWRDIELVNSAGKKIQFTIQEVPADRYEEVLEHMCTFFIRDEATLSSLKTADDPKAVAVVREFWSMTLQQGITIAAFDKSTKEAKPKLAGLNILVVIDDEFEKKLQSHVIAHDMIRKFFHFLLSFSAAEDPRKMFNVNLYLTAFGLSVDPQYRCMGLGKQLLDTRNDIGRVYNISVTETVFTSAISQKVAAAVGFTDHLVRDYGDVYDENGEKLFPSLAGKQIKLMMKKLP